MTSNVGARRIDLIDIFIYFYEISSCNKIVACFAVNDLFYIKDSEIETLI